MKDVAESDFERRRRLEAIQVETKKWYEPDPREAQRRLQSAEKRVRAAMEKVPWNMMEKHLHSDEARQHFKETCDIIRSLFRDIPQLTTRQVVDPKVFVYVCRDKSSKHFLRRLEYCEVDAEEASTHQKDHNNPQFSTWCWCCNRCSCWRNEFSTQKRW